MKRFIVTFFVGFLAISAGFLTTKISKLLISGSKENLPKAEKFLKTTQGNRKASNPFSFSFVWNKKKHFEFIQQRIYLNNKEKCIDLYLARFNRKAVTGEMLLFSERNKIDFYLEKVKEKTHPFILFSSTFFHPQGTPVGLVQLPLKKPTRRGRSRLWKLGGFFTLAPGKPSLLTYQEAAKRKFVFPSSMLVLQSYPYLISQGKKRTFKGHRYCK